MIPRPDWVSGPNCWPKTVCMFSGCRLRTAALWSLKTMPGRWAYTPCPMPNPPWCGTGGRAGKPWTIKRPWPPGWKDCPVIIPGPWPWPMFFAAGGSVSESERPLSVGGAESVAPELFEPFSYTALGHLHRPQKAGSDRIHYSGSLMKYSFSESDDRKSVSLVEIDHQGEVSIERIALSPRRDLCRISGVFERTAGKSPGRHRQNRLPAGGTARQRRPVRPHGPFAGSLSQRTAHRTPIPAG